MTKGTIVGGAVCVAVLVLVALLILSAGDRSPEQETDSTTPASVAIPPASVETVGSLAGFLNGRITTHDGATYEGRLRFGGGEEAFWGDYFNGFKEENPWAANVPADQLMERRPIEILGVEIAQREHQIELRRPFVARFGDIVRVELTVRDIRVTLKSGTVVDLDRFGADDVADGLRVWDDRAGVVDLHERRIRVIEFVPTARHGVVPARLHGTVHTRQGAFTGFVQWGREVRLGTAELAVHTDDGDLRLRFDTIGSIAHSAGGHTLVSLLDGREIDLAGIGIGDIGGGGRGIYVDDPRYGRVLISWDAFERVDFSAAGSSAAGGGPAYDDFPPGQPLTGRVTTRAGHRLGGRLVYDLDESETTETLDAPSEGVNYTIPFGLIASIAPSATVVHDAPHASVTLRSGEQLHLEQAGDLGEGNAGLLIFVDGSEGPAYVPWRDIEQVDFDRPSAMHPPPGGPTGVDSLGAERAAGLAPSHRGHVVRGGV